MGTLSSSPCQLGLGVILRHLSLSSYTVIVLAVQPGNFLYFVSGILKEPSLPKPDETTSSSSSTLVYKSGWGITVDSYYLQRYFQNHNPNDHNTYSNLSVLIDHLSSTDFGLLMQQNELRTGEDEGKQERLNKTVTTFPFIYVIIRSSALANGVSKTT